MKLKLTLRERICFGEVLPEKGNINDQVAIRDIVDKVRIKDEEMERLGIKIEGTAYDLSGVQGDPLLEIELSNGEYLLLQKSCKELDEQRRVTQRTLSVCMKVLGLDV